MLNLESTSSRMSHLARQEIYFDRQFGLDETLEGVERVTRDIERWPGISLPMVPWPRRSRRREGLQIPRERLALVSGESH